MTDIRRPWGKLRFGEDGRVEAWAPLADHCHDVASVFAAMLALPGVRRRLARLAGRDDLDEATCQRLAALCHLHDVGKVNSGFQARSDPKAPMVGHVKPLVAAFWDGGPGRLYDRTLKALRLHDLDSWGPTVVNSDDNALFDAVLSHHGEPWPSRERPEAEVRWWRAVDGYDPFKAMGDLVDHAFAAFPLAAKGEAPPLPGAPGFVHAFAGLVQLADWIASGEDDWRRDRTREAPMLWARRRLADIGIDPSTARTALAAGRPGFAAAFGFEPRAAQARTAEAEGRLVILESETGSGKTEAALWRFVTLFAAGAVDGLYFALPTRTAAVQIHGRVETLAARLWPDGGRPDVVLAVPGYLDGEGGAGALPGARDDLDRAENDARASSVWAAQHPKRYFAATISVGTIDQALLGAIRVRHAHLRAAALMRHLLVVDEVHSSDPFMRRLLNELLRDHIAAGGYALLLSATLGAELRTELLAEAAGGRGQDAEKPPLGEAIATPYPLITSGCRADGAPAAAVGARGKADLALSSKEVAMTTEALLHDAEGIARRALEAAQRGARTLVLRNTVAGAVEVQKALEALAGADSGLLFRAEGVAVAHHSRFAREDRRLLDRRVEAEVGKRRPEGGLVLAGTQTLEQSLDIDADFLITDLCPADVLLQRIGRLHRHASVDGKPRVRASGYVTPRCLVLTPTEGLAAFLGRRSVGERRHGLGGQVYEDLVVLELTRRLAAGRPLWRIPEDNRLLVESALHSEAIEDFLRTAPPGEAEEWRRHRQESYGRELAMMVMAGHSVLRRKDGFMSQRMDAAGERLATRLGARDRIVELPSGTIGPFGRPIRRIAIPGWWMAEGVDADDEKFVCSCDGDGVLRLTAAASGISFVYNRFGLFLS